MTFNPLRLFTRHFQSPPAPERPKASPPQTMIWITREGELMRVCDMKDLHLLNALKIKRQVQRTIGARLAIEGYMLAGTLQGEHALDSVFDDIAEIERVGIPDEDVPGLMPLILEARRRGLTELERK